ncbi:hypothetical protein C1631_022935 [Chryseobacterium phosphatilyticum]|uniref:DNA topoisomerase n=1 Tax=Chryseobacterium phosphatilyticum TaxID=475075 RepID=A0A316WPV2_9FLAO|nr:DNA topoisomerase [Chryseobacterium phosphatilyticum]PWN62423.1 hypothetical protein C1631_022935 [Chryseobacterium phosphatilyticum]
MKVVLAEKPSVAKSIAEVIGARERKNGYFEGNGYQVTWAFGHLVMLSSPEEVLGRKIENEDLPFLPDDIPLKIKKDKEGTSKKQYEIIKKLFNESSEVICATDAGREGELIFRLIYEHAKCKKPFKRLWISSVNSDVIKNGFNNLLDGRDKDGLYLGGKLRQKADWYLGFNSSIAMTKNNGFLLRIGRVKTPTLFLVVKRFLENKGFKPQKFFVPKVSVISEKGDVVATYQEKFFNQEEASHLLNIMSNNNRIDLREIEKKETSSTPPALFNLAELQKKCNKDFGYTADETLTYLQVLYESGFVTYPRTDSRFLNEEMKEEVFKLIEDIGVFFNIQDLTVPLLLHKSTKPFNNEKVTDHHAIIPTGNMPILAQLDDKKKNVYLTILSATLQSFGSKELKNVTTYTFFIDGIQIPFLAKGSVVINKGYTIFKDLFLEKTKSKVTDEDIESEESDKQLPELEKGNYNYKNAALTESQTSAPPLLNDASLITLMETCGKDIQDEELKEVLKGKGIGTSATRGGIIKELVDGEYIERKGKTLLPTKLGFEVIKSLNGQKILSAELTGEWESAITDIENGKGNAAEFQENIKSFAYEITQQIKSSPKLGYNPNETSHVCPQCKKGKLMQNKFYYHCEDDHNCKYKLYKNFRGQNITEKRLSDLLTKGISLSAKCKTQDNKSYTIDLIFNKETNQIETQQKNTNSGFGKKKFNKK